MKFQAELLSVLIFVGFILFIYAAEVFLIIRAVFRKIRDGLNRSGLKTKPAIAIHIMALAGLVCLWYGANIEPSWVEINRFDIYTDKLKNTDIRIVQISDMHCDKKIRTEKKLAGMINNLKPDIVVFTGDTINDRNALLTFRDVLNKIKAPYGKFAVKGNIDSHYWNNIDIFFNTGFMLLNKETVKVKKNNEYIFITGLGFDARNMWYETLKKIPGICFSVFLYHTPVFVESLKDMNVDLYLCGHTHGGQVALPFYGALITMSKYGKKYEKGMYKNGNTALYVNRGIGMEGGKLPRVRFLSRPEIAVFDVHPKK